MDISGMDPTGGIQQMKAKNDAQSHEIAVLKKGIDHQKDMAAQLILKNSVEFDYKAAPR